MKSFSYGVMYGMVVIFIIAILCSFVFSSILRWSSLTESSVQFSITVISFIALFTGGFVSGKLSQRKGWMTGGLTGTLYSLTMVSYQYLGYQAPFHWEQLIYHSCFIVTAMMGGILGVNVSAKHRD
ncbi:TIGR04086 family membrane protein [Bacillus sp. FJAT-52991]|uniref:TIGR04086 family membrane protein n=1 Tax=Bacillus kandeliae TaxID=3129297 RepID=A0ABZ2N369_9BACI